MFIHWQQLKSGLTDSARSAAGVRESLTRLQFDHELDDEDKAILKVVASKVMELERAADQLRSGLQAVQSAIENKQRDKRRRDQGFIGPKWTTEKSKSKK